MYYTSPDYDRAIKQLSVVVQQIEEKTKDKRDSINLRYEKMIKEREESIYRSENILKKSLDNF